MNISVPTVLRQSAEWVVRHRERLFLLAGVLLAGALAFESGFLRGKLAQTEPLVISLPAVAEPPAEGIPAAGVERIVAKTDEKQGVASLAESRRADCPLVGSRNSDKYHLASCAVVKRIKPENRVCFASEEDAQKRGYVAGCLK
ncbi:MAG: hypothetical protein AAB547_03365 [Patescibacteria group bacterium]|mgnify:CR=1 FL=1